MLLLSRGTMSLQTRRWRKADSNPQSQQETNEDPSALACKRKNCGIIRSVSVRGEDKIDKTIPGIGISDEGIISEQD